MSGDFSQGEPPADTGRDQAGRFRKGHSGNPRGPKPGYRHKSHHGGREAAFGRHRGNREDSRERGESWRALGVPLGDHGSLATRARAHKISHEGVARVLRAAEP